MSVSSKELEIPPQDVSDSITQLKTYSFLQKNLLVERIAMNFVRYFGRRELQLRTW